METDAAGGRVDGRASGGAPPLPAAWTAPPVVTAPVAGPGGLWWYAGFLFALALVLASPALLASRAATSPATVLGPSAEAGRTRVQVLEGPRPQIWTMSGIDAPAGTSIDVELRGDCACEPYPATTRPATNWAGVVVFGGWGVVTARRARRRSREQRVTRTARALLDHEPGPEPFTLVPLVFAHGQLELRFALRDASGAVAGTVPLTVGATRSDFERALRVHGTLRPGRVIAISTADGEQGLLPTEPLTSIRSARASRPHPATGTVVDLLGWGHESAPAVVGGVRRVTPSQFGPGRYPSGVVAGVEASVARYAAACRWQRWVNLSSLAAVVLILFTIGWGTPLMVAVVALTLVELGFAWASTRWADRPLAVALAEAELVSVDGRRVARLLVRSGLADLVATPSPDGVAAWS